MNVVFFGTSDFGLPLLEALHSKHSLVATVTTPDKPSGRKLQLSASPVKQWAQANNVPVHDYLRDDPSALLESLKTLRPDLFLVVSFGALLKSDFLTATRHGSLNVHASLLPKYRGASPMQSSILAGDAETGVSVMKMIERLDAGDVQLQKKTPIGTDETLPELKTRLAAISADAALEAIDQLERATAKFTVQDDRVSSYAKKIKKEDGKLDWTQPASALHARVRAFLGWPGTFSFFKGKRVAMLKTRTSAGDASKEPGEVIEAGEESLRIAAGNGSSLDVSELQLEGKKAMNWKEFKKGFPIKPGERFE